MKKPDNSLFRSRLMLVGLMLIFAGPLVIASLMYAFRDNVDLPGVSVYGELVSPARPVEQLSASTQNGDNLTVNDLQDHWTLLYLGDSHCDLNCEASLFKLRQVRLSLGREITRVQRWYLYAGDKPTEHLTSILARHPGMFAARLNLPLGQLLEDLPDSGIYIVDPHGNLMMHYDTSVTSKGILKDMKHLLRLSQIG